MDSPFPEGYQELYGIMLDRTAPDADIEQIAEEQRLFRHYYLERHTLVEYGRLMIQVIEDISELNTIKPENFNEQ